MTWEQLYPVVKEQAYFAVFRYDPRRADKVQELLCQSYEKYRNDVSMGREIKKQEFKCFITQRAKEVDMRYICKKGLSVYRPQIHYHFTGEGLIQLQLYVEFAEWVSSNALKKDSVEEFISFQIDFSNWQLTLSKFERRILNLLLKGFVACKVADKLKLNYMTVKDCIKKMKEAFIKYFHISYEVLVV